MARQLWTVIIFLLLLTLIVQADEGQWKTYTVADGLISPDVTTIFQDSVGNLWFGTRDGGVSRFDRGNFRSFTEKDGFPRIMDQRGLPYGFIRQILEDKQGHLWFIVTHNPTPWDESLVCKYDGKKFHQITEQDGLTGGTLDAVLRDKKGNVWVANKYGLMRYDGKKFQHFSDNEFQKFILAQSGSDGRVYTIFESRSGDIWLAGGPRFGRRGGPGPGREEQREFPFVIRYDGTKYYYYHIESFLDSPSASIHAIAEDDTGNLWFGGWFVLLRYDGKNFERLDNEKRVVNAEGFTPKLGHGEVLLTWKEPLDSAGKPLFTVSANFGPGPPPDDTKINQPKNKDRNYRYQSRIANMSIDSIFKDSKGHLWFNNRGFVSRWDGKELKHFVIPENWEEIRDFKTMYFIKNQIWLDEGESSRFYPGQVVLEDAERNLWFKSSNGAHKFDGKTFQTFTVDDGLGSDNIFAILEAMDGKFWFGHDNGVTLFDPTPSVIQNFTMRAALGSNSVRFIHEDKQGFVWFSVRGGIARYDGKKLQYFSEEQMGKWHPSLSNNRLPLNTNFTVDILDGGKGSVWFIGDDTDQIFRYKDGVFQRYSVWSDRARRINRYNSPGGFDTFDKHTSAVDSEGNLWLAIDRSLVRCDGRSFQFLTADSFQDFPPDFRRNRPGITDIHIDLHGNIWFVYAGEALKRYDGANLKTFTADDGLASNNIRKIFEDRRGNLWFAGEQILIKYDGKSFQNFSITDVAAPPVAIYQDDHGLISFIYSYTVAVYDNGSYKFLRRDEILGEPLGDKQVRASTIDSTGNLWLATNNGIIKYDGRQFTTYTTEDGLLVNDIRDILVDKQRNLWCAMWGGGVAIYNGENFQTITTKDGLVHNNVRSIFEDSQGNLWFATDGGVTKYTLRMDILPRVKLTKVIADNVYTEFGEELQLSAKARRVVFAYQGVSFQQAMLFFTHKLEGYETDWSQPSTEKQVQYEGLKPGRYTFLVKAFRKGSTYSNQPAVLQFTIAPAIWMQSQFYLPTGLAGMTLVVFVFLIIRVIIQRRQSNTLRDELRQKEEAEVQHVKRELNDAREMQMSLLPTSAPHINQFDLAGISLPAKEVGGDFYDYLTLGNSLFGIVLADVSGKGLRGAMSAVMTNGMLHEVIQTELIPNKVLSRLNTGLCPLLLGPMFTALNFGILDPQAKQIRYTNAGQPYPIIKCDGKVEEMELSGLPLGIVTGVAYDEKIFDLNPGDYVIFYTDGITDAMNQAEDIYGLDRLHNIIRNAETNLSAEGLIQRILQDVHAFVGDAEQFDDMTMVVLRSVG